MLVDREELQNILIGKGRKDYGNYCNEKSYYLYEQKGYKSYPKGEELEEEREVDNIHGLLPHGNIVSPSA